MFSLIKLAIDLATAVAIFCAGVKVGDDFPNFATKVNSFVTWVISKL
jgi:hypothetical protein